MRLAPKFPKGYYRLAQVQESLGMMAEAEQNLVRAQALDGESKEVNDKLEELR